MTRKALKLFLRTQLLSQVRTFHLLHSTPSSRKVLWLSCGTGDLFPRSLSGNLYLQSCTVYEKQGFCSAHAKVNCCTGSSPATGLLSSASFYDIEAVRPNNLRFSWPFHTVAFLDRLGEQLYSPGCTRGVDYSHRYSITQLTHISG